MFSVILMHGRVHRNPERSIGHPLHRAHDGYSFSFEFGLTDRLPLRRRERASVLMIASGRAAAHMTPAAPRDSGPFQRVQGGRGRNRFGCKAAASETSSCCVLRQTSFFFFFSLFFFCVCPNFWTHPHPRLWGSPDT